MINVKLCSLMMCCLLVGCAQNTPQAGTPQQSALPASTASPSPTNPAADAKSDQSQAGNAKTSSTDSNATDPCNLISNPEVQAVQGEQVRDTKRSSRTAGPLLMSHCFYQLGTIDNSVSVEITRGDAAEANKAVVKDHWKKVFYSEGKKKDAEKPVKVSGIGDEAYWVGDGRVGVLYVLKNDAYIRISVGGQHEPQEKLKRSKTLAEHALKRL